MTKSRALVLFFLLPVLLSWPCRPPVGLKGLDLMVTFSAKSLMDNLFTDMSFQWKTTSAFMPPEDERRVLVSFHRGGTLLFEDVHALPVPMARWERNRQYAYTRRVYIPRFIDEFQREFKGSEAVRMTVELDSPSDPTGESRAVVLKRRVRVFPDPGYPGIAHMSGWYEPESPDPKAPSTQRRWTSREARTVIDNPRRDALLVIRGETDPEAVRGQRVTLRIGDRVLGEFVPDGGTFEWSGTVKQEWLGDQRDFILTIAVDKTFVPASVRPGATDARELGVLISLVYFK